MSQHRVGIIGYGWAATAHIDAINSTTNARAVAVVSGRALDPADLATRHGHPMKVHRDIGALLADPDIDIVSICSTPDRHAREAIAAARAGRHIILEKPVALTLEDCRAVAAAVEAAGVRACVCFECRFSSQFRVTKSLLDQGLLGRVHHAEVDYYHGVGPWYGQYRWNTRRDAGGSSLLSAGCHAMDGLLLFMGDDIASVTSLSARSEHPDFRGYEYPTTSVTLLRYRDGRIGKVASVLDALSPYTFRVHLVGSEGTLMNDQFWSGRIDGLDRGRWSTLAMKRLESGDVADHPYALQFQAFFDALDAGGEMPLTNLRAAMRTHEIIFAADRSAAESRTIAL